MSKAAFSKAIDGIHPHDHACLIYDSPEQRIAAAVPYIRRGLMRNERCIYVADEDTAEATLAFLEAGGVSARDAVERGQLVVMPSQGAYIIDGVFDPERMIAFLDAGTKQALADGYDAMRITGEMSWVLNGEVPVEQLLRYERDINEYAAVHRASGI